MRGVVAKRIRKSVYGDQSLRQKRKYVRLYSDPTAVRNDPQSLRTAYQRAKKRYLANG